MAAGWAIRWAAWSAGLLILCGLTGRLTPHLVPDSPSYLNYAFSPAATMAEQIRTPVYPLVLRFCESVSPDGIAADWIASVSLHLVIVLQVILHALAVTVLCDELARWRFPRSARIAAGLAVAVGCTFWQHVDTVAPDCAAMSVGVLVAVLVMRSWRSPVSMRRDLWIGVAVLVAIGLRPAYLFLIPWVGMMQVFRVRGAAPWSMTGRMRAAVISVTLPVLLLSLWCGFRYRHAGDFSILPFGHQNLAAVTTQLLDNDELASLPGDLGELGVGIGRRRVELAAAPGTLDESSIDGLDLREPADASDRADSYMTLENRWDAMTYLVIQPIVREIAGDPVVAQHRMLADLNRQIVRAYPGRYWKWWLLAVRRGVWGTAANIAMHPFFLGPLLALVAVAFFRWTGLSDSRHAGSLGRVWRPDDPAPMPVEFLRPLALVAITFGFSKLAFVSLSSPPIGRFVDAGFVLLPAWLFAAATIWVRGSTKPVG